MEQPDSRSWNHRLTEEDLAFIKRFVLASGSLKELASIYGISYPTVRLRLDRIIQKISIIDDQQITSEFERALRVRYAEGRMDINTMKELLNLHKKEIGGTP